MKVMMLPSFALKVAVITAAIIRPIPQQRVTITYEQLGSLQANLFMITFPIQISNRDMHSFSLIVNGADLSISFFKFSQQ